MPDAHEQPNILITGTPGVGKTTFAKALGSELGFEVISVGEVAESEQFFEGVDEKLGSKILDDEALLDWMEDRMNSSKGGVIVEYHGCDFFPERWFDAVLVLRCDNTRLYDRLAARGYTGPKLENNIQAEIFGTIADEASESYPQGIIQELQSATPEDEEANIEAVKNWLSSWTPPL